MKTARLKTTASTRKPVRARAAKPTRKTAPGAAPRPPAAPPPEESDAARLARAVRDALNEKKAGAPVILDVRGSSGITDFHVLATGNNGPHLKALAAEAARIIKQAPGHGDTRTAGAPESGWIILDGHDIVVHLFSAPGRSFYDLESLWADARRLD